MGVDGHRFGVGTPETDNDMQRRAPGGGPPVQMARAATLVGTAKAPHRYLRSVPDTAQASCLLPHIYGGAPVPEWHPPLRVTTYGASSRERGIGA